MRIFFFRNLIIFAILGAKLSYALVNTNAINDVNNEYIYEYVDNKGNLIITNKPPHKNAKKMKLPNLKINETPISEKELNKLSNSQLEERKINRKYILQEELNREFQELQKSVRELEYNKKFPIVGDALKQKELIKKLEEKISEHKKNIDNLNKLLSKPNG